MRGMQIKVVYMGGSRVQAGCAHEHLQLAPGATVGHAVQEIMRLHPALAAWQARVRWACNFEFVEMADLLQPQDELALLPPVAGGAPRARLTTAPLSVDAVAAQVAAGHVGATVFFVGTVRDHNQGQAVQQVTYEAYGPMAERVLERIAAAHSVQGVEVAIAHRHGCLQVGEASVIIAAAAAHRAAAFDSCRAVLEVIKLDVPIYKREQGTGGETWVGWGGG